MRKMALISFFALAGCLGQSGIRPLRPLEIPTAPFQDVVTKELTGTLMYEGECLLFREDGGAVLLMPVWPSGTIFNGTAVVFHEPGKAEQRVMIAEQFQMGGRPADWGALNAASYQPVHHQCGAFAPFYVSSVRPAN